MKKILLIEDDEDLKLMFTLFFRLENFQVISTENSAIGLQLAKQLCPDLILCDPNTPDLNGYEVLKELRADLTTAKIPFVVITSASDEDSCELMTQIGADDYLPKPKIFQQSQTNKIAS